MCAFPKSRNGQSRVAEEPAMRSRMTLTSKCQLVLHFLLFTLTVPRTGVHNHAKGSLHIWTLLFFFGCCSCCLYNFFESSDWVWIEKKAVRKREGEALCAFFFFWRRDGSLLWGHSLDLGRQHRLFGGSRKAYYPFGGSTGQGNATCPLQSPQQLDLLEWRYTAHYSVTPFAPETQRALRQWREGEGEKKAGAVSQYELGRLKVIKSTFLDTSASKGCFFPSQSVSLQVLTLCTVLTKQS